MTDLNQGRWTHGHDGKIAVFLIGLRINKLRRPDVWVPSLNAMGPMIAELSADPDSGFLGVHTSLVWRGPLMVQYWRSTDDIFRYARDAGRRHRPAWTEFYRRTKDSHGVVGLWHEAYEVPKGAVHSMYVDMPATGLAGFTSTRPQGGRTRGEAREQAA